MKNTKGHIRLIISGGGTGGHVYPAIAIADAVRASHADAEILFVGAQGKMEMEKVPKAGYEIIGLWISGLQRRLTWKNVLFPFKLLNSSFKSMQIIRQYKPHVVIGVGGYASGTIVKAAQRVGVPTVLQEQNGYAGLTNKLLAKKAKRICVAYPGMEKYFPKEAILFTGNPVRKDIMQLAALKSDAAAYFGLTLEKPTLLVTGGSLGARTLNQSMMVGIMELLQRNYQVVWQTGKFYIDEVKAFLADKEVTGLWFNAFIDRMDYAYALADVVISRAGALSISELTLAGKPAILVPSPNVAEDHQTKNAMALVKEDAAHMVTDADAPQKLVEEAIKLLADAERQAALAQNIAKLGKPEAAKEIANEIIKLAEIDA